MPLSTDEVFCLTYWHFQWGPQNLQDLLPYIKVCHHWNSLFLHILNFYLDSKEQNIVFMTIYEISQVEVLQLSLLSSHSLKA